MKFIEEKISTGNMSERQNIGWKHSWHDDYLKWVCGFTNAIGGTIYFGKENMGHMAGYIDTWGRGTLKIIEACKEAGLAEPLIEEMNGGVAVTLFKKEFGKASEDVRKKFGRNVEMTFNVIVANPEYSAEKIAQELKISPRTVEKHQAKLKEAGVIERTGSTKTGYWEIIIKP
jgi:predicted HTH transcriptional regulator